MTIEPPQATIGLRTDGEKVPVASDGTSMYYTSQMTPATPDQYVTNDPNVLGTSPSSMFMYEQDVSDMQKSLLSPASTKSSSSFCDMATGPVTAHSHIGLGNLGRIEESRLNMEDMELSIDCQKPLHTLDEIKTEPAWSPGIPIDTGQATRTFKYEDVFMNKRSSGGPTLAELNTMTEIDDVSVLDDINSIISSEMPNINTLKIEQPIIKSPAQTNLQELLQNAVAKSLPTNLHLTFTPNLHRQPSATITSPNQSMSCDVSQPIVVVKSETQQQVSFQPPPPPPALTVFQPNVYNVLPPMENNKPKAQQVDWSYPGELSAVDRPSLLRLLAPDTSIKTNASGSAAGIVSRTTSVAKNITARRPIHIPKRTRGLSEGSGLMHLEAEARHGLKRPLSDESDTSNTSGNSFTRKWEEIRKYMEDESGSSLKVKTPTKKVKVEPPAEITTGSGAFSQQPEVASHDYATDSDSDLDFSDTESIGSHSSFVEELLVSGKKDKRFFWQYNTQAKGPKGKRLCRNVETADPHVLNTFEDPVFDPEMNDAKYRHTGRARKGDGNDVTPSPWKLFQIGNQLKKLNKKIHDIAPPGDLPATVRNDSRREKNKFASRACRLKKKAQHEANKIKMYGLDTEHAELISVLNHIKGDIVQHNPTTDTSAPTRSESYIALYDRLVQQHLTAMIAGNTSDYVNSVLEKVAQGDRTGGLDLARR